jgi:TonB family protein
MTRKATLSALCFAFIAPAGAQTPTPIIDIKGAKGVAAYAVYEPKPIYPYMLRSRHVEGAGAFLVHIRSNGSVQSVETLISTGHPELDDCARAAFLKWRFRPGRPTKVPIPITFSMHGAHAGT